MAQTGILIATADAIEGRNTVRVLGLVRGSSVRARNVARDVQAGVRTIFGGQVGVYAELLEQSREEAIAKMTEEATALGANPIVATRLSTSQIMGGAAEGAGLRHCRGYRVAVSCERRSAIRAGRPSSVWAAPKM